MGGGSIIKKVAEHKKKIAGADRIRKSGGSIRKKSLPVPVPVHSHEEAESCIACGHAEEHNEIFE